MGKSTMSGTAPGIDCRFHEIVSCLLANSATVSRRDDFALSHFIWNNFQYNWLCKGGLQAQQQSPGWFVKHNLMLRSYQEDEENTLGFFILKLPDWVRQPPEEFSHTGWRFGLHNRENLDSGETEALKIGFAVQNGLVGEKWVRFCEAIVEDPKSMLACYGLTSGVTGWSDDQIRHVLSLDALFLASYMDWCLPQKDRRLWRANSRHLSPKRSAFWAKVDIWWSIVAWDLFLVENQIPFALIDKVVEYLIDSPVSKDQNLLLAYRGRCVESVVERVIGVFMNTAGNEAFKLKYPSLLNVNTHILGAAYEAICGSQGLLRKTANGNQYVRVPSATKLQQSGIQFLGVPAPLFSLSYKNGCLRIPKMHIYDHTICFVRNMAWHEETSVRGGCVFHDYIFFMNDLIEAPEDLNLLIERGVVYNGCGVRAFGMWMGLREGLWQVPSSQAHHEMKLAVVRRCRQKRYRLWSEFNSAFCSRPWVVLSTIAVVLVTLSTLVQTYIAVIGSNRMRPVFP